LAEDWEGILAAACGMKELKRSDPYFFNIRTMLVHAMMAAESRQSRAGISAIAKAFSDIGRHEAASIVLGRIRTDWPGETKYPFGGYSGNCGAPAPGDG
jgi:hypothetical protein